MRQDILDRALTSNMWKDFVTQETTVWHDFHKYWLNKAMQIETYFVAYEELLIEP